MVPLNPTIGDRVTALLRPSSTQTVRLRRIAALALAGLGVALLLRGSPGTKTTAVVVAAHDLAPGRVLITEDLTTVYRAADTVADGAFRDASQLAGHMLAGAARTGETITDVRILGPRLAAAASGTSDGRIVPIRLADAGIAELLREGDHVDVVGTLDSGPGTTAKPAVLARDAVVVLVSSPKPGARGAAAADRILMVALPAQPAISVAASSLSAALTVVIR